MKEAIIEATTKTQNEVNRSDVVEAIRDNDRSRIEAAIPWQTYDEELAKTEDVIRIPFNETGGAMIVHLPPSLRGVTFDSTTPRAIRIVQSRAANLVRDISMESRAALRLELEKALEEGLGADATAKNIINNIGLTKRQATALGNFRRNLIEAGASSGRIERDTNRYAKRLLEFRAERIARTELMAAANEGHLEMMKQGQEQGIIPGNAQKVWIVTPDDRLCPWCAPMEGQTRPLNANFVSGLGNVMSPPLHPMCRCVMGIEIT